MDGGVSVGAPGAVEPPPFGGRQVADGVGVQGAAEGVPGAAEAGGGGIEGAGAGDEGVVEGVGGAAAGAVGAEVQAADAAFRVERHPERFIRERGAEGSGGPGKRSQ